MLDRKGKNMAKFNDIKISIELRPCLVDGRKALFHQWCVQEDFILKFNAFLKPEQINKLREKFQETGIVDTHADPEKIKRTYALVEFEDGSVDMVDPMSVRFLDGSGYFDEICWD